MSVLLDHLVVCCWNQDKLGCCCCAHFKAICVLFDNCATWLLFEIFKENIYEFSLTIVQADILSDLRVVVASTRIYNVLSSVSNPLHFEMSNSLIHTAFISDLSQLWMMLSSQGCQLWFYWITKKENLQFEFSVLLYLITNFFR